MEAIATSNREDEAKTERPKSNRTDGRVGAEAQAPAADGTVDPSHDLLGNPASRPFWGRHVTGWPLISKMKETISTPHLMRARLGQSHALVPGLVHVFQTPADDL